MSLRALAALASLYVVSLSPALADEAEIRRMVREKLPGAAVESVQKAPIGDLYEVVVRGPDGAKIFYTDGGGTVILSGQAIETRSGRNLTEERLRTLNAVKWSSLPFDDAITIVRGNGRRKIAVFSGPNCPYCQRFEKELARLDDITVHIFLYPVIKAESLRQTKAVWCSKDRAAAWRDLMLHGVQPGAKPDCDTPVEKLVALGRRLGANATPTWFLETGERYSGAVPPDELRELLDRASASAGIGRSPFADTSPNNRFFADTPPKGTLMNMPLRKAFAVALLALAVPAAAQSDKHERGAMGGMMGGQGMGDMTGMMQGCSMMRGEGGGHAMPHLPPGNEKLELQMHADMMRAMADVLSKYAARLPERK